MERWRPAAANGAPRSVTLPGGRRRDPAVRGLHGRATRSNTMLQSAQGAQAAGVTAGRRTSHHVSHSPSAKRGSPIAVRATPSATTAPAR